MTRLRQFAVAAAGCAVLGWGLAGCADNHPQAIDPGAIQEAAGDQTVSWTASSDGRISVYDQNTDKIVYGTSVRVGQAVSVDVTNNRIMLDGQLVNENSLHRGDQYRIYFEPTSIVHSESTVETHTESEQMTH